jgi:hypothetical protein
VPIKKVQKKNSWATLRFRELLLWRMDEESFDKLPNIAFFTGIGNEFF